MSDLSNLTPRQLRVQLHSTELEARMDAIIEIGKRGLRELADDIAPLVTDAHPEVRADALRVLAFYWKLPDYEQVAERMMSTEPDEETRSLAVMAWAGYHDGTRAPAVMARLREIMSDERESWMVTSMAYHALFAVCGVPAKDRPRSTTRIDWARVERLFQEHGGR